MKGKIKRKKWKEKSKETNERKNWDKKIEIKKYLFCFLIIFNTNYISFPILSQTVREEDATVWYEVENEKYTYHCLGDGGGDEVGIIWITSFIIYLYMGLGVYFGGYFTGDS